MKQIVILIILCIGASASSQEIFTAYENENYEKIKNLLENRADANQVRDTIGITLMYDAAWDNNIQIAKMLHKYGGKVDLPCGKHGVTPLLPACQQNSFEIVKFLVNNGADANQKYKAAGNQTPIRFACKTGNIELVNFLLENGADLENEPDDRLTPLIQASRSNHYDLVKFLIEKGANVNAYARDKECALNQAIKNNNYKIVKLLIDNGAKLSYVDEDGHSSLKLAKKSKNSKIIKLIKEND